MDLPFLLHYTQVKNSTKLVDQYIRYIFTLVFLEKFYQNSVSYYVVKDENNNCAGLTNIHGSRYHVVKKSVGIIKRRN